MYRKFLLHCVSLNNFNRTSSSVEIVPEFKLRYSRMINVNLGGNRTIMMCLNYKGFFFFCSFVCVFGQINEV